MILREGNKLDLVATIENVSERERVPESIKDDRILITEDKKTNVKPQGSDRNEILVRNPNNSQ